MRKPAVLVVGQLPPKIMQALEDAYVLHRYWTFEDKKKGLAAVADSIRGIATTGHYGASREMIFALRNLEIISSFGVGTDAIDIPAATERGVPVTNTPDVLTDDVANTAVMMLLAVSRDLVQADRYVRAGKWVSDGNMPLTRAVRGKTVGIIGLGRIGADIARKLDVFGVTVVWHGPRPKPGVSYRYYEDVVQMAADADYLVVACPGGESTHHIVNADVLKALGPEGSLINISRGSCVDEDAVVAAMAAGTIGWAGLDVFANEPQVPAALIDSERTLLLPHVGSATEETRAAMGNLVIENLALHFAGKPLATQVNAL
ncbi:2-hydroxyacid dehydrogenase [Hwanghaeella grinnelliae]|uniref:2-hydroxyacid dehydrogenase n=1 Tax=Hwanghaeella grinnelliae TaxID=2500179 RepID=A0A437QL03_9PROT|nr:2-hydroxyacid dehydrogenase [Hwanghaeella grinnelliae]RVU35188.1 2-hydroxyacid dehydrogenase [Hwanghaeella grinnelliae]